MKKVLCFIAMLVASMAIHIPSYAIEWMLPGGQYLIDDDMLSAGKTAANDGWDSHEAGGDISCTWGEGTCFLDNSIYTDVDMIRKFKKTTSGRVSLEYLYWFEKDIDGFRWMVRNGDTPVVTIKTKGQALYAVKPDGSEMYLTSYSIVSESDKINAKNASKSVPYTLGTGVRIDMNLDTKLYNIYIDSKLCGENIPMCDNVIDNLKLVSTKEGTGNLRIIAVRCYKDYWVNETHVSSPVSTTNRPESFKVVGRGGKVTVEQMNSQLWTDVTNIRMRSSSLLSGELSYSRELNVTDDLVAFEFMVIDTEKKGGLSASFGDGINITMDNDAFSFNGKAFYSNYYKNLWYNVKVIADYKKGLCDVYLNNIKRLENQPLGGTARNSIRFEAMSGKKINIGLDDIRVYPMLPQPSDYVSTPQKVDSPLEVGMWSCSLWRSGRQSYGWDKIKPWPDREPVLGFYDEGNPEVNDWETKYMAEHGVDFQMFCWFKPDGSYASPIKTPNWSYALEDGLKMSKYKDMQKYAIMFENLTASITDVDMFKNYVAPYWIEYYFKDPNYYRYNNKPVLNIYNVQYFVEQLSGGRGVGVTNARISVAKETLKWFNDECIRQGFDGVELWTADFSVGFDKLRDLGFVCGCPYGHDAELGSTLSHVKTNTLLGNIYGLDMIGVATTGMDPEPWTGQKGIMTDVDNFDNICNWIANEYAPKISMRERGAKIAMIDNWNELGEGHFVCPTKATDGWTRLDSIRKNFTNSKEAHTHTEPTDNQKSRIQVLYDQNRKGFLTSEPMPPERYPDKVLKGWYFDSSSVGWTFNNVGNPTVTNGALYFKITGNDTPIMYMNNVGIDSKDISYIKIRVKLAAEAAKKTQVFFKNETMSQYIWDYSLRTVVENGDFRDVYINTSTNSHWSGEITNLRLDLFNGPGEYWIESVELLGGYLDEDDCVVFGGNITPIKAAQVNGVPMLDVAKTITTLMPNSKLDCETEGLDGFKFAVGADLYEVKAGNKKYSANGVEHDITKPFTMHEGSLYAPIDFFLRPLNESTCRYNSSINAVYFSNSMPEVAGVSPAHLSEKVTQYEYPIVTFDAQLDCNTISNIKLKSGDETIATTNKLSADGFSVTIVPNTKLDANTEYTIFVPGTVMSVAKSSVTPFSSRFTTADTNLLLDCDFNSATEQNLSLPYGISSWEGSCSLGSMSGSDSFKMSLPNSYNWVMINFPTSINANQQRKFVISFDMLTATNDRKWTDVYWHHAYNNDELLVRYDSQEQKRHYEFLVDSTIEWDAGLKFINPNGVNSNFVMIDNLKIEYLDDIRVISTNLYDEPNGFVPYRPITITFNKSVANPEDIELYDLTDVNNPKMVACIAEKYSSTLGRETVAIKHSGLKGCTTYAIKLDSLKGADFGQISAGEKDILFTTSDLSLTGGELFIYDFENEINGDNGITNGLSSSWAIKWDRNKDVASSGNYSLKIDTDYSSTGVNGGNIHFKLPGIDYMKYYGNEYKLKIDLKDGLPIGSSNISLIIAYYTSEGRQYKWLATNYQIPEYFYTLEKKFVIDESAEIYSPTVYLLCNGDASFYIDNFSVEKIVPQITLYGDGTEIKNGITNAEYNVTAVYNNIPIGKTCLGAIAIYKNGSLVEFKVVKPTSDGADNKAAMSLPTGIKGYEIKAFLWDSFQTLKPMLDVVSAINK